MKLSILIYLCVFLFPLHMFAQNLIKNGGFEQHGRIECMECYHIYGKYPSVVYHWDNMGWGCFLFDKDYQLNTDEKKWNPMRQEISAYMGKAMIQMTYIPISSRMGDMSYLNAKTVMPLEVGKQYEVRFNIYIESKPDADPNWAKNIGIALLPAKPAYQYGFKIPAIRLDTVIFDTWYEAKWIITPLCTANYLMIGVYRTDEWPNSKSFANVQYFIDEVSISDCTNAPTGITPDSAQYYCSQYSIEKNPKLTPGTDKVILFFETADFEITPSHAVQLNTFANYAKKHPKLVFEIAGHTDSIGTDNLTLSQKRAAAALRYLQAIHGLPDTRFFITTVGDKDPLRGNKDEAGRAMNRRVEIRQLDISLGNMFYREALAAKNTSKSSALVFSALNKWLRASTVSLRNQLLFDPRFEYLHNDQRWTALVETIKDGYRNRKYPEYAFLIDSMRMADRRVLGELSWDFCEMNSDSLPFQLPISAQSDINQTQKRNFIAFKTIVNKIGWPKISDFGETTAFSAFMLLQHCQDSTEWTTFLPVIRQKCEEGEASWEAFAMLYDRCQLVAGKPQLYGTHCIVTEQGGVEIRPFIGDKNSINAERKKIGLPLLSEIVTESIQKSLKKN